TNTVSKIDPNVVANVQANADLDNQESVNDEGYGVDDAEYYEGEDVNEEMLNEEALNEEMSNENMNEGTDNWEGPAQEEGNAKMPVGNAAE
ncbi:MAG: hypothetical protein HY591_03230, partial [Candidatus Omnitrophica bacterium]|nr:hypothetical protein [Candidatus Omnitrophota bacterium]